jgi:hypothetical protein
LLAGLSRAGRYPLWIAALAIVLALPALGAGWLMDDYYHRAVMMPGSPFADLLGPPREMFRFFRGDPARTIREMDLGIFPWWTDPTLKAEFLQALTVFTHRLDYALWPESPVLMHAHSLLWLGAAVAAVAVYYRRMLGPTWVAALAAILYAFDDAHGPVVGFIANRNSLVAATFGVCSLIAYDRWRRDESRLAAFGAPLLLLAALFSKEEGIGTVAYLAAYALCLDPKGIWRGCLALTPTVMTVVVWRTLRDQWGYGVRNVGLYVDPITDPGPFLAALVERVPLLLLGLWGPVPAETAVVLSKREASAFWWLAVCVLVVLTLVLFPLLRRDRLARFWGLGMVFAVIPVSATLAMDRLLTFAGIGAFGLLSQFFETLWGEPALRSPTARPGSVTRGIGLVLIAVHLVWSPLSLLYRSGNPLGAGWVDERMYVQTSLGHSVGEKTLVVVNAPSAAHAGYTLFQRALRGEAAPRHIRVLAPAVPSVSIKRLDASTLEITPSRGYLGWVLDRVFRCERRPLSLGEEVKLTGMTARVTALSSDGRPATVTFRFDEPLESESFVWLCFKGSGFERFIPPPPGQAETIPFDWRAVLTPRWLAREVMNQ